MIDFKKLNSNLMINMMKRLILTSEGLSDSLDEVTETDGIDMAESQSSFLKVSYHDYMLNVKFNVSST